MSVDEALLAKARLEAGRHAEAERQVLLTRADYHAAVRRLHLAGASLREVAQALHLSHQRVQQIVGAAGGSWWQRAWRSRTRRDAVCTFCGRPPADVAKLIAGPNVFICDRCIASAEAVLTGSAAEGFTRASGRCSFCGTRSGRTRAIVAASDAKVCNDCVHACREILDASEGR